MPSNTPTLDDNVVSDNNRELDSDTYTQHTPNSVNTKTLLVKYGPHIPRSPRFQAVHFSLRDSAFFSRLPALVMSLISFFCHSAPRAGTVTSSTGPAVEPSLRALGVGGGSG